LGVSQAAFFCYNNIMKINKKFFSIIIFVLALVMCKTPPRQVEEKFTVEMSSPQLPVGEIETQINRGFPLSGIRKIVVTASYFPYEDAVCLRYRSDFFTYYQFWSQSGREVFLKALETYNGDYSVRNLDARNKNSKNVYGTTEGFLIWQEQSFTRRVSANMNIEMGYAFNDGSPYYSVTQKQTFYDDPINDQNDMGSQEITMYFTRAQAQELALLFNQQYLRSLVSPEINDMRRLDSTDADTDEY